MGGIEEEEAWFTSYFEAEGSILFLDLAGLLEAGEPGVDSCDHVSVGGGSWRELVICPGGRGGRAAGAAVCESAVVPFWLHLAAGWNIYSVSLRESQLSFHFSPMAPWG